MWHRPLKHGRPAYSLPWLTRSQLLLLFASVKYNRDNTEEFGSEDCREFSELAIYIASRIFYEDEEILKEVECCIDR